MRQITHNQCQYAEYRWSGQRPVIYALHGFLGSGSDFSLLADELSVEMVAWDLIGFGRSDAPTELEMYSLTSQLEFLAAHLPDNALLLGYSMGARLALQFACRYSSRLSGLILISGTAGIEQEHLRQARKRWDFRMAERVQSIGLTAFLEEWNRLPIIQSQQKIKASHREKMLALRRSHSPIGVANSMRCFGTGTMPSCWHRLPYLDIPVLRIVGEDDSKYVDLAQKMNGRLPIDSLEIVPSAGHCVHLERPRKTADVIHRWTKRYF